MSESTERDREMARKLLSAIMGGILGGDGSSAFDEDGATIHAFGFTDATRKTQSARIEIALAPIEEAIATAREEGRNARERELLALTDRDFIIISRKEYDRLQTGLINEPAPLP